MERPRHESCLAAARKLADYSKVLRTLRMNAVGDEGKRLAAEAKEAETLGLELVGLSVALMPSQAMKNWSRGEAAALAQLKHVKYAKPGNPA